MCVWTVEVFQSRKKQQCTPAICLFFQMKQSTPSTDKKINQNKNPISLQCDTLWDRKWVSMRLLMVLLIRLFKTSNWTRNFYFQSVSKWSFLYVYFQIGWCSFQTYYISEGIVPTSGKYFLNPWHCEGESSRKNATLMEDYSQSTLILLSA